MDEIEVFTYGWTNYDGRTDTVEAMVSKGKVTRAFYEDRLLNGKFPPYSLFEETVERVPSESIIEGKYRPDLHRRGFQKQVDIEIRHS